MNITDKCICCLCDRVSVGLAQHGVDVECYHLNRHVDSGLFNFYLLNQCNRLYSLV